MSTPEPYHNFPIPNDFLNITYVEGNAVAYVAGYVSKKIKVSTTCVTCRYNVFNRTNQSYSFLDLVNSKEFGGARLQRLKYINEELFKNLLKTYNIVLYILKKFNLKKKY